MSVLNRKVLNVSLLLIVYLLFIFTSDNVSIIKKVGKIKKVYKRVLLENKKNIKRLLQL